MTVNKSPARLNSRRLMNAVFVWAIIRLPNHAYYMYVILDSSVSGSSTRVAAVIAGRGLSINGAPVAICTECTLTQIFHSPHSPRPTHPSPLAYFDTNCLTPQLLSWLPASVLPLEISPVHAISLHPGSVEHTVKLKSRCG